MARLFFQWLLLTGQLVAGTATSTSSSLVFEHGGWGGSLIGCNSSSVSPEHFDEVSFLQARSHVELRQGASFTAGGACCHNDMPEDLKQKPITNVDIQGVEPPKMCDVKFSSCLIIGGADIFGLNRPESTFQPIYCHRSQVTIMQNDEQESFAIKQEKKPKHQGSCTSLTESDLMAKVQEAVTPISVTKIYARGCMVQESISVGARDDAYEHFARMPNPRAENQAYGPYMVMEVLPEENKCHDVVMGKQGEAAYLQMLFDTTSFFLSMYKNNMADYDHNLADPLNLYILGDGHAVFFDFDKALLRECVDDEEWKSAVRRSFHMLIVHPVKLLQDPSPHGDVMQALQQIHDNLGDEVEQRIVGTISAAWCSVFPGFPTGRFSELDALFDSEAVPKPNLQQC